jgi:glutathione S-transferase
MAETQAITLWGAGTTRTLRPIWVAEELGLEYELKPIGPRTGETQTPEYTRLNPKQKIPYLIDDDVRLSESVAISRYLIARYGHESTIAPPQTPELRAREDEWVCYIYGELDETSLYVMRRHGDLKAIYGDAPAAVDGAKDYAMKHLQVVANHLDDREFVLDGRFGLADIVLTSCLDWAVHYGFDLAESLIRYRSSVAKRPAYRRALVSNAARQSSSQNVS